MVRKRPGKVRDKLVYYPTVTREPFRSHVRLPDFVANGKLCADIGLQQIDSAQDRAMVCGGPAMLKDMQKVLDGASVVVGVTRRAARPLRACA